MMPTQHANTKPHARRVLLLHHYSASPNQRIVDVLRKHQPDWRFESIPGKIDPGYRTRISLYLRRWPQMLLYGLRQGGRAIGPDSSNMIFVAWSHLPLLPIVFLALLMREPPKLVLCGFIYTHRNSRILNWLRWLYFRVLLSKLSLVICHSRHECEAYKACFGKKIPFAFVPFCIHVPSFEGTPQADYAVSAGRSGRDYPLLLAVFSQLDIALKIISDSFTVDPKQLPTHVEILRNYYLNDYLRILAAARLVVIPLMEDCVSAGQMVLLEAMALGRPIVITRTKTTQEYCTHLHDCILVPKGDAKALHDSIRAIYDNSSLAAKIGENAKTTYQDRHSIDAEARHLIRCLDKCWRSPRCTPAVEADVEEVAVMQQPVANSLL